MIYYYSDANPLLRWAEAKVPKPSPRCQQIGQETERIIQATDTIFAISEITIAEFHSNLFKFERDTGMPDFGELEADRCLDQLMKWIVAGQIQVVDQAPKIIEKAMAYVRLATRNKACALRAWDAVHLTQANYWSRLMDAPVNIVTNDGVFLDFLRAFPEFTESIRVYNPLKKRFYP